MIGRLVGSVATAAEQSKADREDAVADSPRVSSRAGKQEEEELKVWQQDDRCPHPHGKVRADALRPADGKGRS